MVTLHEQPHQADRLYAVTQQVGFTLWQIQGLESAAAQYYVLTVQAKSGMGTEPGQALVDKAQNKTFGATITQLVKTKHLPHDILARFQTLLTERNWLVHSSRSSSRDAIHNDQAFQEMIGRLESIASEAELLLKEVRKNTEEFVKRNSISKERIEELTAQLLKSWHEISPT
ncbi:hypothetical protein [Pseudomonas fluorescens]|uniref:hypothetical protein n=1 Tax=Pseudomonas fluorescens TaxID=294 RepID=UPI003D20F396